MPIDRASFNRRRLEQIRRGLILPAGASSEERAKFQGKSNVLGLEQKPKADNPVFIGEQTQQLPPALQPIKPLGDFGEVKPNQPNQTIAPEEDIRQQSLARPEDLNNQQAQQLQSSPLDVSQQGQATLQGLPPSSGNFLQDLLNLAPETAERLGLDNVRPPTENAIFDESGNIIGYENTGQGLPPELAFAGVGLAETALSQLTTRTASPIVDLFGNPANQAAANQLYKTGATTPGEIITNAKTVSTIKTGLINNGVSKRLGALLVAGIGTYGLAEWARLDNTFGAMEITFSKIISQGDPEAIAEVKRLRDELYDEKTWEKIARTLPYLNLIPAFTNAYKVNKIQRRANDLVAEDVIESINNPDTTFNDQILKRKQQESDIFRADTVFRLELEAYYKEQEREANRQQRDEDAAFWRKQRQINREEERRDREEAAAFWLEYAKKKAALGADNSPSKLAFGLL